VETVCIYSKIAVDAVQVSRPKRENPSIVRSDWWVAEEEK
jgi:hypothetical protein